MCCKELKEALAGPDVCYSNSNVAKEKGKEFRIEIKKDDKKKIDICRVIVDDCLIKNDNVKKCDYLFKICPIDKILLVELKGVKVFEGVKQIESTYKQIKEKLKIKPENYEGYIVSSSVPKDERKFRKLQDEFYNKNGFFIRKEHTKKIYQVKIEN